MDNFKGSKDIRSISIVSRKTLADQQIKTFKDMILKLQYDDFSNCVVYYNGGGCMFEFFLNAEYHKLGLSDGM